MRRKDTLMEQREDLPRALRSTTYVTVAMVDEGRPCLVTLSHGHDEKANRIDIRSLSGKRAAKVTIQLWRRRASGPGSPTEPRHDARAPGSS